MSRIYTRGGDEGITSLGTGERVAKDSLRIEAHGEIDELNSLLGLALAEGVSGEISDFLLTVQNDLFLLGSELAFPRKEQSPVPGICPEFIQILELKIDHLTETLPPLLNFILPGGSKSAALLHLSRTVCRRAERFVVSLSHEAEIDPLIIVYLNRLSDLLFTMARYQNYADKQEEKVWRNMGISL